MATAGVAVVARAAAGRGGLPGLNGRKLAARGEYGAAPERFMGGQCGLSGLW
jgi:hypothetical protein